MNHPTKYEALAGSAEAAANAVQAEIEKAQQGLESVDSLRNLLFIKSRLEEISKILRGNEVFKDDRFKRSMGRIIVDTWPLRHSLGESISQIEYEFERLK